MQSVDSVSSVTGNVHNILNAGYSGIIRYISPNTSLHPTKKLTVDEIASIHSVDGMTIGIVFENNPTQASYFTDDQASADGANALAVVASLGIPQNIPVFFTVDYDASSSDISGCIGDYFTSVHSQFEAAGRLIGVYGSGAACQALKGQGVAHFTWLAQSTGWMGYASW